MITPYQEVIERRCNAAFCAEIVPAENKCCRRDAKLVCGEHRRNDEQRILIGRKNHAGANPLENASEVGHFWRTAHHSAVRLLYPIHPFWRSTQLAYPARRFHNYLPPKGTV